MFETSLNSEFLRTAIRANGIPITQTGERTDQLLVSALACCNRLQNPFSYTLLICIKALKR